MIETQRCKLRGTFDLCLIFDMIFICELKLAVNTQLHNFYIRSFARVLYFVLIMKEKKIEKRQP